MEGSDTADLRDDIVNEPGACLQDMTENKTGCTLQQKGLQHSVAATTCCWYCMHACMAGSTCMQWMHPNVVAGHISAGYMQKQYLLFAGFDEALGIGRGVVPLQLTPRILQVLLVAVHTHARRINNGSHACIFTQSCKPCYKPCSGIASADWQAEPTAFDTCSSQMLREHSLVKGVLPVKASLQCTQCKPVRWQLHAHSVMPAKNWLQCS